MQTLICHAAQDLRIEDTPPPGALLAHELLVRVAYGGICGSDLHYQQHGGFGTVRIKEPMALGHEVSGVIEALGTEVQGLKPGQRIAISPSRPCGTCRFCQLGQHNHCLNMRFYGSAMPFPHIQGAFSELLVIEASQAHRVADHLSLSEAALAEPLSVGLHAIQRAGGVLGKQVLVTGCGPIGSLLIGGLRRAGAARIVAVDLFDLALECARRMGADETINLRRQPGGLAPYKKDKGQFDAVFEASGSEAALRNGLDVIAPRGTLVTVGLGGDIALPMNQIVAKEIELRGSFRFHPEFATAVQFLNQGLIDGKPVITRILPLAEAVAAFALAGDKNQSLKVQIAFGDAPTTLQPTLETA
jgi:L-idonate 5-dehydrogenase